MLPLKVGDKVNTTFGGIDPHGKDCLYQWKFLPFDLKNALVELQRGLSVNKSWFCQMLH
jgi:hypothetical protein